MENEKLKMDKKMKAKLILDKKHIIKGQSLVGSAIVQYKDFKNDRVRLRIESVLESNCETSELTFRPKIEHLKKKKSFVQQIWVKMSRVAPKNWQKNPKKSP